MDPKAAAAMQSFVNAMHKLESDYVQLMQRMGCKRVTLYRF